MSKEAESLVLQEGDTIFVPLKPQTVSIVGEVNSITTLLYESGKNIKDYINLAGGYGNAANESGVYILKSDGLAIVPSNSLFSQKFLRNSSWRYYCCS